MMEKIGELRGIRKLQNGSRVFYFGTISSDKLRALTFVPAIESGQQQLVTEIHENGYQRPGSPSRMRKFAKYLEENPNSVIPPVILSSRDHWVFRSNESSENIGVLDLFGPAAIIDGQHRVGGYIHHYEQNNDDVREVCFILMQGLSIDEEARDFSDINSTQKGVPRALNAFLAGEEPAQIAWDLNEDPDSPFHGRISRTTVARNQLFALHSVANQIKELFKMGGLNDLDMDTKENYASRFFTIVSDVWQNEWSDMEFLDDPESSGRRSFQYKMLELTGLIAWCRVGSSILHRSYQDGVGINWDSVKRLVEAAGQIDWRKTGKWEGRTGLAGAKYIAEEMESLLTRVTTEMEYSDGDQS